jgi:hypothetical protein
MKPLITLGTKKNKYTVVAITNDELGPAVHIQFRQDQPLRLSLKEAENLFLTN